MIGPPDIGFVIQLVLFGVLYVILKYCLFDPALRVLDLRRQRIEGPTASAEQLRAEATVMREKYEAALEDVRTSVQREIAEIRRQGEIDEARILEAARAEAAETIDMARTSLASEVESVRSSLLRRAAEISVAATEKVLGRSVQ